MHRASYAHVYFVCKREGSAAVTTDNNVHSMKYLFVCGLCLYAFVKIYTQYELIGT